MAYEPLHHKYRPQTFAQLVGQDAIATTLANALNQQRIAPAYLFCGPRGTGKTSSARILAKSLNCLSQGHPTPEPCGTCETCRSITNGSALDFVEIDAASNTGVDNIRELIERAQFAPVQCRYKVYVIDECHMLSTAAFNALLKTLEEPPDNVVFVLATTDPQRVLPTIISRCQRFDYRRIPLEPMITHLKKIAAQEAIDIDDEALRLVAQVSQGGLRDAQSLLDQLSLLAPPIGAEAVWDLVGAVPERDLLALVQAILSDDSTTVLDQARKLMERGREPLIVLQNLAGFYRDLLIAKTAGNRLDLVVITPPTWAEMQTLVQGVETPILLLGQQHLRSAELQVKNTTQPRLWLEVTLMGLLPSALAGPVTTTGVSLPTSAPATGFKPTPSGSSTTPIMGSPLPSPEPPSLSPPAVDLPSPPPPASNGATPENHPSPISEDTSPPPPEPQEPPSFDAQEPPPADPQAPFLSDDANLEHLWQQVLAALQPLGTRALMQQQGRLLFFDGTVARIGISSKQLYKMAQGRTENVEAAFEKVLQQTVQVSLEVLPDPKPEAPYPEISQPPDPKMAEPTDATSPMVPPPVVSSAPLPPLLANPPDSRPTEKPSSTSPLNDLTVATDITPSGTPLPEIVSDFDRAVKNFAQFFNGQVVDLSEDMNPLSGGQPLIQPSEAAAKQPSHPDKDVPF
jgi:DNA polymerase-3 subunit gamma/tau